MINRYFQYGLLVMVAARCLSFAAAQVPTLSKPANNTVGVDVSSVGLSWTSTGANSYGLQISTSQTFPLPLPVDKSGIPSPLYTVTTLSPNTTYYWHVNAKYSSSSTSAWSSAWNFTTGPRAPTLSTPSNNATGIESPPIIFGWNTSTGATSYRLQVSTSSTFSTIPVDISGPGTSNTVVTLSPFKTYYWRVNATSSKGTSIWSNVWNFTTVLPKPVLTGPGNGVTGIANPTLTWNSVANATSYLLQVATDIGFTNLKVNNLELTSPSYNVTNLSNTTYYWRVQAKNASGTSSWCAAWSFTAVDKLKIAFNQEFQTVADGGSPLPEDKHRQILAYYKALGYNYMVITMPSDFFTQLTFQSTGPSAGHWVYHSTLDVTGQWFRNMKDLIESTYNMHVLPSLPCLSHLQGVITGWSAGNDLSEFASPTDFHNWAVGAGIYVDVAGVDNITQCNQNNSVAWANNGNTTAQDLYVEQMKIINDNWTNSGSSSVRGTYPPYILLGHDEIGAGLPFVCFVGKGKTLGNSAELIANEINTRCNDVSTIFHQPTQIILYGDCFVPGDEGNGVDQMAGTGPDGTGGVLQILRDTWPISSDRCIIAPWNYYDKEGEYNGYSIVSKTKQVQYLNSLRFKYLVDLGEEGGLNRDCDLTDRQWGPRHGVCNQMRCRQVVFEWVRATQIYPRYSVGFIDALYEPWVCFNQDTFSGFTAPILAYLAWTYGDKSLELARYHSYSGQLFKNVDYIGSRRVLLWNGYYSRPPITGPLNIIPAIGKQ